MISAQRVLLPFRHLVQLAHPAGLDRVALRVGDAIVDRVAPHACHLSDIRRDSLPPFDLDAPTPIAINCGNSSSVFRLVGSSMA